MFFRFLELFLKKVDIHGNTNAIALFLFVLPEIRALPVADVAENPPEDGDTEQKNDKGSAVEEIVEFRESLPQNDSEKHQRDEWQHRNQ